MKNYFIFYFFLCLSAIFSSCSHSYYLPSDNMIAKVKEEKELMITGTIVPKPNIMVPSPKEKALTGSVQLAYSPIKHLSIAGSYFNLSEEYIRPDIGSKKFNNWNMAIGAYYFINFNALAAQKKGMEYKFENQSKYIGLLLDLYAGYGQGRIFNTFQNEGTVDLDFQKYFVQLGLQFIKEKFEIGGGIKHSILNYFEGTTIQVLAPELGKVQALYSNTPYSPMVANFKIAAGYRNMKLYLNINKVILPNTRFQSNDPLITIGLQANVLNLLQKNKN